MSGAPFRDHMQCADTAAVFPVSAVLNPTPVEVCRHSADISSETAVTTLYSCGDEVL